MRESEEYLESSINFMESSDIYVGEFLYKEDANYAVKLAYKEGYLEAIDKVLELIDDKYFIDGRRMSFEILINNLRGSV